MRVNSAAAKSTAESATVEGLVAQLAATRADFLAFVAAAAAQDKKPAKPATKRLPNTAPNAADKAKWKPGRLYCWAHDFVKHNGNACTVLEDSGEPQWKKDAVNPGPLHGQCGSRTLE